MKLCLVSLKYDESGGGSNRSLRLLAEKLSTVHSIQIHTLQSQKNTGVNELSASVKQHYASSVPETLKMAFDLFRQLDSEVDLYHLFSPILAPAGGLYRKLGGKIPVVCRLNSYSLFCTNPAQMNGSCFSNCTLRKKISHDDSSGFSPHKYLFKHSSLKFSSNVDQFFAQSEPVEKIYRQAGLTSDISIVPNFYDTSFCDMTAQNNNSDSNIILYVGRLNELKGVEDLIVSVSELSLRNKHLKIVGGGQKKKELEDLAQERLSAQEFTFTGWTDYDSLSKYYKEATVFVHPGKWPEPFGNTILEAMQHKLPIIVSDIGGPVWILQDDGYKFSPGCTTQLSIQLEKVLTSPESVEYSDRLKRFSPNTVVSDIKEGYKSVL